MKITNGELSKIFITFSDIEMNKFYFKVYREAKLPSVDVLDLVVQ